MSIEFGFSKFRKKLEFNLITVRTGAEVFCGAVIRFCVIMV